MFGRQTRRQVADLQDQVARLKNEVAGLRDHLSEEHTKLQNAYNAWFDIVARELGFVAARSQDTWIMSGLGTLKNPREVALMSVTPLPVRRLEGPVLAKAKKQHPRSRAR